eukprot:m.289145 g.289145  ORF g.289145 m.289145 type:complete len:167 (+) comp12082_c0_seq1:55-555(+)
MGDDAAAAAPPAAEESSHPSLSSLTSTPAWAFTLFREGWTLLARHGWTLVAVAAVLAFVWYNFLEARYTAWRTRLVAGPPIKADPEAVLQARLRQQEKTNAEIERLRKEREQTRRAKALGEEKPQFKRDKVIVRRGYGGDDYNPLMGDRPRGGGWRRPNCRPGGSA